MMQLVSASDVGNTSCMRQLICVDGQEREMVVFFFFFFEEGDDMNLERKLGSRGSKDIKFLTPT